MNKEYEEIIIGGKKTEVRSYESALDICKRDRRIILKTSDYLSALFNNLGFRMKPNNFDFIDKKIPIEDVKFKDVLMFNSHIPNYVLMNYMTSLDTFLKSVRFWCKGKVHSGLILNTTNTYQDKISEEELLWNQQNNFDIKRPAIVSEKVHYWYGSDIKTSRLYNINPNINEEYFDKHIQDFDTLCKRTSVEDTWLLFIMALVEPDSIMSLIRKVEMEAIKRVSINKYAINITPDAILEDFQAVLRYNVFKIHNIYYNKKLKGVVDFANSVNQSKNISRDLAISLYSGYTVPATALNAAEEEHSFIDKFALLTLEQKKQYVKDLDFTSRDVNISAIVNKYVDISNLTKMLKKQVVFDPNIYNDTIKNIYIIISQINIYIPNYINGVTDKLVLSKNLFVDKDNFGLFNKNFDNFIFMDENFNICMCDIDKICKFIKDKYGKDVRLVPKEDMGNKKLEKEIPDLDFEYDEDKQVKDTPLYTNISHIDEEQELYSLEGLVMDE